MAVARKQVAGLKPRWDVAPPWVKFAAKDWVGQEWWFEFEPSITNPWQLTWTEQPGTRKLVYNVQLAPKDTTDWKTSLVSRPADKQFKQHMHFSKIVGFYRGREVQSVRRVDRYHCDNQETNWVDQPDPAWELEHDYRLKPKKRK